MIAIDNSKAFDGVTEELCKASYFTQDARAKIAQTRRLLKEIKYEIEFKLVRINKRFHADLLKKNTGISA